MGIEVEHGFFLMKYLVGRCETFLGKKKRSFLIKHFLKNYCFVNLFIRLLEKYIVLVYEWYIIDKKRLMFESKNECLIKNLKCFDFEMLFLIF